MAATSSFTEGSSVFGGQANLLQAITNIFTIYEPDIIAVHTTCLSETIGDDIPQIISKAQDEGKIPSGKRVIHANTPSYVGSHVTGFANMTKAMVDYFAEPPKQKRKIDQHYPRLGRAQRHARNQTPGKHPGRGNDIVPRYIRRARRPADRQAPVLSQRRRDNGGACQNGRKPGDNLPWPDRFGACRQRQLDGKFKIPFESLELPIGLKATDRFVNTLRKTARVPVPQAVNEERGRLVDMITDMHQYFYGKRVAIVGRSRPTGFAGRVPCRPRHASGLHGYRHARQTVR